MVNTKCLANLVKICMLLSTFAFQSNVLPAAKSSTGSGAASAGSVQKTIKDFKKLGEYECLNRLNIYYPGDDDKVEIDPSTFGHIHKKDFEREATLTTDRGLFDACKQKFQISSDLFVCNMGLVDIRNFKDPNRCCGMLGTFANPVNDVLKTENGFAICSGNEFRIFDNNLQNTSVQSYNNELGTTIIPKKTEKTVYVEEFALQKFQEYLLKNPNLEPYIVKIDANKGIIAVKIRDKIEKPNAKYYDYDGSLVEHFKPITGNEFYDKEGNKWGFGRLNAFWYNMPGRVIDLSGDDDFIIYSGNNPYVNRNNTNLQSTNLIDLRYSYGDVDSKTLHNIFRHKESKICTSYAYLRAQLKAKESSIKFEPMGTLPSFENIVYQPCSVLKIFDVRKNKFIFNLIMPDNVSVMKNFNDSHFIVAIFGNLLLINKTNFKIEYIAPISKNKNGNFAPDKLDFYSGSNGGFIVAEKPAPFGKKYTAVISLSSFISTAAPLKTSSSSTSSPSTSPLPVSSPLPLSLSTKTSVASYSGKTEPKKEPSIHQQTIKINDNCYGVVKGKLIIVNRITNDIIGEFIMPNAVTAIGTSKLYPNCVVAGTYGGVRLFDLSTLSNTKLFTMKPGYEFSPTALCRADDSIVCYRGDFDVDGYERACRVIFSDCCYDSYSSNNIPLTKVHPEIAKGLLNEIYERRGIETCGLAINHFRVIDTSDFTIYDSTTNNSIHELNLPANITSLASLGENHFMIGMQGEIRVYENTTFKHVYTLKLNNHEYELYAKNKIVAGPTNLIAYNLDTGFLVQVIEGLNIDYGPNYSKFVRFPDDFQKIGLPHVTSTSASCAEIATQRIGYPKASGRGKTTRRRR